MANSQTTDPSDITKLLSFFFDQGEGVGKWFKSSDSLDSECKTWVPLVEAARENKLKSWSDSADGTLALIILLDQLPRNIYRGNSLAFSSVKQALSVAVQGIAQRFDRQVELERQMFFYLPLMHHESLLAQVGSLALYESLLARAKDEKLELGIYETGVKMADVHLDVIKRFGRYPGRNKALGRESTQEEIDFLKNAGPAGF